jgi:hypothetical protein
MAAGGREGREGGRKEGRKNSQLHKSVPCLLIQENCINMSHNLQLRLERDPEFLLHIVTDDKMWVYSRWH